MAALCATFWSGAAAAQPAGLEQRSDASSGTTEVAKEGFQKATAPPEESKDATSFKLSAGGLWTAATRERWRSRLPRTFGFGAARTRYCRRPP